MTKWHLNLITTSLNQGNKYCISIVKITHLIFFNIRLYHQIQDKYEYEDIVNMIGQYSMADRHDIHVIYETKYHSVQNEDINHLFENLNKHQEVLDPD